MADFGSPVAAGVNVNPNQGIQTISGILGLQQQQAELQRQRAVAYQAAQSATERQNLAQIPWKSFQNDDGSFDMDKVGKAALSVAPTTGQEFVQRFGQMAEQGAETKKAYYSLNQDYQNGLRSVFGTWAGDPKADIVDLSTQLKTLEDNAPETAKPAIHQLASHSFQMLTGPDVISGDARTPEQQKAMALAYSRAGLAGSEVSGPGGVSTPNVGGQYDAQGNYTGFTQNKTNAQVTQAPGAGMHVGLGPTQTPSYLGAVARASSTGSGVGQVDVDRTSAISGAQQPAAAAIKLTQRVDALSHEVANSLAAKKVTEGLHTLGFSNVAAARTELQKDLGLLKGPVAARAGSDSRAAELLEGYPTDTTPENTVHSAMDYIRGTMRQTLARGQLLNQHGPAGIAAADDELTRGTDPLMHEAASLQPGQSNGFYKRNFQSPQEAQAFKNRVDALKKHTNFLGGDNEP